MDPSARRALELPPSYDFRTSLQDSGMGPFDPTCRYDRTQLWRVSRLPSGPATLHVRRTEPGRAEARAWGAGAEEILTHAPEILGLHDDPSAFAPEAEPLAKLARRHPGLHLPRVPDVFRLLVQTILLQRVRWKDGAASFRQLCLRYGEPAPGPNEALHLIPEARRLARMPAHAWADMGVEQARARVVVRVAQSQRRVDETREMSFEDAETRLRAFPGVGPWTAGMTMGFGLGFSDAAPTGDLGLPHLVAWNLEGVRFSDDDRMLALLEPYRPHRWRVIRLLHAGGTNPPRRSPGRKLGPRPGPSRRRGRGG